MGSTAASRRRRTSACTAGCARALRDARAPRRRAALGTGALVAAAVRYADAHGTEALSMRALARELGVEAMSLYSHVHGKEALLGLMAAHVVEGMELPARTGAPRARLRRIAEAMRAAAYAHPAVFPLVVLMPLEMKAAVRPTEAVLGAFLDAGADDARAIRCQRVFLSFVRGYLLWELGAMTAGRWTARGATLAPASVAQLEALDGTAFPETRRLAGTFARISPDQAFAEGVEAIIDALLPARPRAGRDSR